MFSFFFKKASIQSDFGFLQTDMHSHILPGIDDGAPNMETSIQLVKAMIEFGYKKLIATPHIYQSLYPNTTSTIEQSFQALTVALMESNIDIPLSAAAEYFMDEHFEQLLDQDQILTLPGKHVLVEMSFMAANPKLHEIIFKLCTKGYQPILAHPERYLYYSKDLTQMEEIKNYGCKLQVNLLSLQGYYGKPVEKFALQLLQEKLVDFLGTDLHHAKHKDSLSSLLKNTKLMRKIQEYPFLNNEL